MYVQQLVISFVVFGILLFLMAKKNKTKNIQNVNNVKYDSVMGPDIGTNYTAVKITFFLLSIGMLYIYWTRR